MRLGAPVRKGDLVIRKIHSNYLDINKKLGFIITTEREWWNFAGENTCLVQWLESKEQSRHKMYDLEVVNK